jgi:hypothetical protein
MCFDTSKTYWARNGKYQAEYDRLIELMPSMGKADTVAGELIRATSKLGYDFYNNGMGNNTSGAIHFLAESGVFPECHGDDTFTTVYEYTRGRIYNGAYNGDSLHRAIERTTDRTIEFILAHPELETAPNDTDMHDLAEDDQVFCEECGDEVDGRGYYGSICSYCEQAMEEEYDEEEEEYEY